jgi:hypothetical protein
VLPPPGPARGLLLPELHKEVYIDYIVYVPTLLLNNLPEVARSVTLRASHAMPSSITPHAFLGRPHTALKGSGESDNPLRERCKVPAPRLKERKKDLRYGSAAEKARCDKPDPRTRQAQRPPSREPRMRGESYRMANQAGHMHARGGARRNPASQAHTNERPESARSSFLARLTCPI